LIRASRRKNTSTVSAHAGWRQHHKLLLTPRSVRIEQIKEWKPRPTALDGMLMEEEASALERWAANEQPLSGRAKTQRWDNAPSCSGRPMDCALIADHLIDRVNAHGRVKRGLNAHTAEILAVFTAMQNRTEGALSLAQYGLIYCPKARNKSEAFLKLIVEAAKELIAYRY
jgi:hypothetical protein